MKSTREKHTLTLFCEGRIDSGCSRQVGTEIGFIIEKNEEAGLLTHLVFDFEHLEYISSAGLREFLVIAKKYKNLKIVNASTEVYDIFHTTGFSQIIPITRKLREVSVEGCDLVGKGANGKVYRLDQDTIIKVYSHLHQYDDIQESLTTAKQLFLAGVPVAISYDVVKVGKAYGAIFEMLDSDTLGQFISKNPDKLEEYAIKSAGFLRKLHHTEMPEGILPDARQMCRKWITENRGLDETAKHKLIALCNDIPARNTFIHGDFHCGNIMIKDGKPTLIDIDEAAVGDPVFDFAMMDLTFNLAITALSGNRIAKIMGITVPQIRQFWSVFEKTYYNDISEADWKQQQSRNKFWGLVKAAYIFDRDPYFPSETKKVLLNQLHRAIS